MERISIPNLPGLAIEFDESNQAEFGPCPDCGEQTKRVWGYVYRSEVATAAYFVEWTPSHAHRDAVFDLIVGQWGEDAGPSDRQAVSVAFRVLDDGPAFKVQDASARRIGSSSLVSTPLNRDDIIGQPIARTVFDICDLIYLADPRVAELRNR